MNEPGIISVGSLLFAFIPVAAVVLILYRWSNEGPESVYGLSRMLGQLLIIGYFLSFIFESNSALAVLAVLLAMVLISSWIALRTVKLQRRLLYASAALSVLIGGGLPLAVNAMLVLSIDPWFSPRQLIPLAGMAFANAMNSIAIAAERFQSELQAQVAYEAARATALRAALIPITNSLFAVGLVALPGMMTGQILAGVDPLVAARYQIMVMCMLFASSGLSAAVFLLLLRRRSREMIAIGSVEQKSKVGA